MPFAVKMRSTFTSKLVFTLCKGGPLQTGKKSRSYFPGKRHFAVNKVKDNKFNCYHHVIEQWPVRGVDNSQVRDVRQV